MFGDRLSSSVGLVGVRQGHSSIRASVLCQMLWEADPLSSRLDVLQMSLVAPEYGAVRGLGDVGTLFPGPLDNLGRVPLPAHRVLYSHYLAWDKSWEVPGSAVTVSPCAPPAGHKWCHEQGLCCWPWWVGFLATCNPWGAHLGFGVVDRGGSQT